MISRRTARLIAEPCSGTFTYRRGETYVDGDRLYDFLFDHDWPAWFCNVAKGLDGYGTRSLKNLIMKLHTGETVARGTHDWTREQREKLGQQHLEDLAEDILGYWNELGSFTTGSGNLIKSLELDGYQYSDSRLVPPERDVLDVQEESGVLESLHDLLGLPNKDTAFHHLKLSEEHYLEGRWDDSISNSRKFLESVLQEVAAAYSSRSQGVPLSENIYKRPGRVRDYLEKEKLLEAKEKEAVASVYGLLSQTGGHPYMAQNDQARLLRHLALTFAQFVLLRLKGQLGV